MQILPFMVLVYFAFHSYLLKSYGYDQLSGHMLYIMFLHIYLLYYKQSTSYTILRKLT